MGGHLPIRRWHVIAGICLINGYRIGAELGVSTGRFSAFLAEVMPELKMYCVDLWEPQGARDVEGAETYTDRDHNANLERFRQVNDEFLQGRCEIMRMSTLAAADKVANHSLDFVFIDADHTEEGCRADILAWTPKVRPGGLISGHDYNWPSVERAVLSTGPKPIRESDNVWLRFQR